MAIEKRHISKLKELHQFVFHNGHCYVPITKEYGDLYEWTLRIKQSRSRLSKELVEELERLGFDWKMFNSNDLKWQSAYYELQAFKNQYGHCMVPSNFKENPYLGSWVKIQRGNEQKLPTYRKKLLNEIGFLWKKDIEHLKQLKWEENYKELIKFKKEFGHCRVTAFKSSHKLSSWVQRIRHNKAKTSSKNFEKLDALGFLWADDMKRLIEENWHQRYKELNQFYKKFGHCRAGGPKNKSFELHSWVTIQRKNVDKLSKEKKELLEKLGFEWSAVIQQKYKDSWYNKYNQLKAFYKKYGHCRVPPIFNGNHSLSIWVRNQYRRPYQLGEEQKKLLDDLDFHWDGIKKTKEKWGKRMERLKAFKEKYGHCKVPQKWEEDKELARWVGYLKDHQKTRLPQDLVKKLDAINFEWRDLLQKEKDEKWLRKYNQLVDFKNKNGHLKLPNRHELYQWAANQRNQRYNLRENRRQLLDKINFEWEITSSVAIKRNYVAFEKKWMKNYQILMEYFKKNGHTNVKFKHPKLGLWVFNQRRKHLNKKLSDKRFHLLDKLNFNWEYKSRTK